MLKDSYECSDDIGPYSRQGRAAARRKRRITVAAFLVAFIVMFVLGIAAMHYFVSRSLLQVPQMFRPSDSTESLARARTEHRPPHPSRRGRAAPELPGRPTDPAGVPLEVVDAELRAARAYRRPGASWRRRVPLHVWHGRCGSFIEGVDLSRRDTNDRVEVQFFRRVEVWVDYVEDFDEEPAHARVRVLGRID